MNKTDIPDMPPKGDIMWIALTLQEQTPYIYDKSNMFWLWNGTHYKIVDQVDMLSMIYNMTVDSKYLSGSFKSGVMEALKIVGRKINVKEKPKEWIHFQNVIIDLKTWEQKEPDPGYLLTEPIPHNFIENTETPTFDKLFSSWVDEIYIQTLYEVCAYVLLDDYPIHRIFLLHGSGRNGKGQFRDILKNIVGESNTTATTIEGLVNNRFESSRLYKNKLCTVGETDFRIMENTSVIKMATGGDPIPAEYKGKPPFTFVNTAKMVINTNSLPQTKDKTEGFYSRWILLNFKNKFNKGKNIIDTITPEEYNSLVSRLIYVLHDLLEKGEFHEEGTIKEKMILYESVSNPLNDFIEQYCTKNINDHVPFKHFKEEFTKYLLEKGQRTYTDKDLRIYLTNEGYTLKANTWFNELNKQLSAIMGLDLIYNPWVSVDRTSDGTMDDFLYPKIKTK